MEATSAHPRSRGENITWIAQLITSCGSSPLTRGKPGLHFQPRHAGRLIPAHAGKTAHGRGGPAGESAHPRSRGENDSSSLAIVSFDGSSPLTRGKLPKRRAIRTTDQAHPRSRGENASRDAHNSEPTGSSPLTRGKREVGPRCSSGHRLIPAHAGKTKWYQVPSGTKRAHPRSRGENPGT